MSRRTMILVSAGMLLVLSLVVSSASLAREGRAEDTNLTPDQRERFVEGAGEIAGLSEGEVSAALKNPAAIQAIPVRVEETRDRPENRAGRSEAARCNTMGARRNYFNAKDQLLFAMSGRKEWCFDFTSAVTSAPPAVRGYLITDKGQKAGWTFRGTAERSEGFVTYRSFPRGGHFSRFVLRFKSCVPGNGCLSIYPQYRGVGYYTGIGYQSTKTLEEPPDE